MNFLLGSGNGYSHDDRSQNNNEFGRGGFSNRGGFSDRGRTFFNSK